MYELITTITLRKRWLFSLIGFLIVIVGIAFKNKESVGRHLSVSSASVFFDGDGGTSEIVLSSNADWSINNPAQVKDQRTIDAIKEGVK